MAIKALRGFNPGGFLRSVTVLMSGASLVQVLSLLVLPVLTQIYSPSGFKVLAVFSALAIVTSLAACLGFDAALPFAETEDDAVNLLGCAALGVSATTGLVTLLTVGSYVAFGVTRSPVTPDYAAILWLLPLATLMIGATSAMEYWSTRRHRFALISQARIAQVVVGVGVQVALGYSGVGPTGLLLGYVLTCGLGFIFLCVGFWRHDRDLLRKIDVVSLRRVAGYYGAFPRFTALESLANAGSVYLPVLVISMALAGPEAGFIALAVRLVQAPLYLIGRSVGQVYLSRALESLEAQRLKSDTARVVRILASFLTGPLIAAVILAPEVISLILGPIWRPVGVYIVWILPWIYFLFLSTSILPTMYALKRNALMMGLTIFGLILRTGTVSAAAIWDKRFVVPIYAASGAVFYGVLLLVVMWVNGVRLSDLKPPNRWAILSFIAFPLGAYAIRSMI